MKYLFPLLFLLIFACSPKLYTGKNFTVISVGHGGGFTGETIEYRISQFGKVEKKEPFDKTTMQVSVIGQLDDKILRQIDEKLKAINLPAYTYQQPGNYSHFIELRQNSQLHKIVWADGNEEEVRRDVIEFYRWLTTQISQLEQKP